MSTHGISGYNPVQARQPAQPAPDKIDQRADLAFNAIKKVIDAEVAAFKDRVITKAPNLGNGFIPVAFKDKASGDIGALTVRGQNILKFADDAQIRKIAALELPQKETFDSILQKTVEKLLTIKAYAYVIAACEPTINGRLSDSKFVKAIVIQASGL